MSTTADPRQFYRSPRRRKGGWKATPVDDSGRVRLFISLTQADAALLDAAAGPFAPTSWAAGELVAVLRGNG